MGLADSLGIEWLGAMLGATLALMIFIFFSVRNVFHFMHFYLLLAWFYTFIVPVYRLIDANYLNGTDSAILIFKLCCHIGFIAGVLCSTGVAGFGGYRCFDISRISPDPLISIWAALSILLLFFVGVVLAFGSIDHYLSLYRSLRMNVSGSLWVKFFLGLKPVVPAILLLLVYFLTRSKWVLITLAGFFIWFLADGNRNPIFFSGVFGFLFYEWFAGKVKLRWLLIGAVSFVLFIGSFKVFYYYFLFHSDEYSIIEYIELVQRDATRNPLRLDNSEFRASYTIESVTFQNPDLFNSSYLVNTYLLLLPKTRVDRSATLESRLARQIDPDSVGENIRFGYSGIAEAYNNLYIMGPLVYFLFGFFINLVLRLVTSIKLYIVVNIIVFYFIFYLMRSSIGATLKEFVFLFYTALAYFLIYTILYPLKTALIQSVQAVSYRLKS